MAQTFPSISPIYGVEKNVSPFVTRTRFQDGYEQIVKFGLNVNPKSYTLTFDNITEAESDVIETFLDLVFQMAIILIGKHLMSHQPVNIALYQEKK